MRRLGTRKRLLGLAAAGVAAVAGGAAYAAIPDRNGVIHACYNRFGGGAVRVIDASRETCRFGESPISWTGSGRARPGTSTGPHQVTSSHDVPTPAPAGATWFADCPSGEVAVGGGGLIERFGDGGFVGRLPLYGSVPYLADPQGWVVTAGPAPGKGHITITVYVTCARSA
jgi:hypothetical protein